MKAYAVVLFLVVSIALVGCAPIPPAQTAPTAAAPTVTATTGAAPTAPTATASPEPTVPAAETPAATGTAGATPTAAISEAPAEPTIAPGFRTYRDPVAGFAIDYPANWSIQVPAVETRAQAQAYTASIRSDPQSSTQPGDQLMPPGQTGIDVTVVRTQATSLDEALAERRAEIQSSELGVTITNEFDVELAGRLRAVRRQLETAQAGTVAELTTFLNGKRIMVLGMGNLDPFDRIAASLRPIAQGGSGVSPAIPVRTPDAASAYSDAGLGFTFALPAAWELCQDSGMSRLFCRRETTQGGAAFPRFFVSLLPPGFTNADASAYNFVAEEDVAALMALPMGQSYATEALPDYSTFTRLADMTVDERPAVVVENAKVWEGGPDTRDRRVFVKTANGTVMLGTYYQTAEELAEFERVLSSVTLMAR